MSAAAQIPQQNVDTFVHFALTQIEQDVHMGKEMLEAGTKTSLAQDLELMFVNPLRFSIDNAKTSKKLLLDTITSIFVRLFSAHKDLFEKIFKADTHNGVNYYIVLKEDNTGNREVFFDLLDKYEYLQVDHILPIHISFLPKSALDTDTGLEALDFSK